MMEFLIKLCNSPVAISMIVSLFMMCIISYVLHRYYKMRFDQVMRQVMKHDDMIERFVYLEDDYKEHMRKYH